jgi:hypothetical protein
MKERKTVKDMFSVDIQYEIVRKVKGSVKRRGAWLGVGVGVWRRGGGEER